MDEIQVGKSSVAIGGAQRGDQCRRKEGSTMNPDVRLPIDPGARAATFRILVLHIVPVLDSSPEIRYRFQPEARISSCSLAITRNSESSRARISACTVPACAMQKSPLPMVLPASARVPESMNNCSVPAWR
jgi:hypothetical protein